MTFVVLVFVFVPHSGEEEQSAESGIDDSWKVMDF